MKNASSPELAQAPSAHTRALAPADRASYVRVARETAARPDHEFEIRRALLTLPAAEFVVSGTPYPELAKRVLWGIGAFALTLAILGVSPQLGAVRVEPARSARPAGVIAPALVNADVQASSIAKPPAPAASLALTLDPAAALPAPLLRLAPLPGPPIRIPAGLPPARDVVTVRDLEKLVAYDRHIRDASARYDLPVALIRAVIAVESNANPRALSSDGAIGLMQLMPRTALRMGVRDPYDPRDNIMGGARLLRVFTNTFEGDLRLVLAAYNAGAGTVREHGGVPPYEQTRRYVDRVLSLYESCRELSVH